MHYLGPLAWARCWSRNWNWNQGLGGLPSQERPRRVTRSLSSRDCQLREGRAGVCPVRRCVPAAPAMTESVQKNQTFRGPTGALRSPHGSANHFFFFRDTSLTSVATRALLNPRMNKILADALQREEEGARKPQKGGLAPASPRRDETINKRVIWAVG